MTQAASFEPESERLARQLRDDILDGTRGPGTRLVERDLAAELGVSRVPVRDALRRLVAEGLVIPRPRSWAVVRAFTAADISDLNEVRSGFESLAFRLAAVRYTSEGLEWLGDILEVELDAARAGDAVRARRAAADFHEAVVSLAANDLLSELERTMRSRMRWLFGQHTDLMAVARQHERLYSAIADRDVTRVEKLVAEHLSAGQPMPAERRPGTTGGENGAGS